MATVADLNVRLGLLYDGLDKGLNQVERKLRRSGDRLSKLGSDLTIAISAPLAAFGVGAIRAAGDYEALGLAMRSTFESAGRSAAEADKEVQALRKAALAPGLDFEQAVKASIRLQGVEYSAEAARKTIEQVANAVTMTGGTAQNLESVTVQMSQMISKGKVLAQDLRIIQENMPVISKLMKQAFGTSNADDLQKAGITGREFVDKITAQMEKLPRVSGGISNAIVNAGSAVKNFLATVGIEINRVFDLGAKSEQLSTILGGVAERFKALDDSTKRNIVYFGLAAVAAGPLIKVYGVLSSTGAQVISVGRGILDGFKSATGVILNAASAFGKLNTVMKASVIGAVIVGVTALYLAYDHFANSLTDAERAQASVLDVTRRANEATIDERTKVMLLTDVLKDNTAKREDQQKALKELQAISPQYFGNLDLEKSKVGDINTALEKYTASILRAAKAQAAFEQIKEIEKQLSNLNESAKPTLWQQLGAQIDGLGNSYITAASEALSFGENVKEQRSALEAQRSALVGVIKENSNYVDVIAGSSEETKKSGQTINDLKAKLDALKAQYEKTAIGTKEFNLLAAQIKAAENQLFKFEEATKRDTDATKKQKDAVDKYLESFNKAEAAKKKSLEVRTAMGVGPMEKLPQAPGAVLPEAGQASIGAMVEGLTAMTELTTAAGEGFSRLSSIVATGGTLIEQVSFAMASAFQAAGASGEESFGKMALAAVGAAAKIIRAQIQEAVTAAAASALKSIPFPFNIAAAAAAGALASGLFNKLVSSVGIPALAEGGVISGPTTALMGEYPGARTNPEIVTPENKMRDVFKGVMRNFGGMGGGALTTRISGRDILFILEQAQYDSRRTRGR